MNRRLLYQNAEGYLKIIVPSDKFQQFRESEEECLARLSYGFLPDVAYFLVCTAEHIPEDFCFRDAWVLGDIHCPVMIDLFKAIDIHRSRLKKACDLMIEDLSRELEVALEKDDLPTQVAIRKTKNILRTIHLMDLTHCKNCEQLKFAVPKELHKFWDFYPLTQENTNASIPSQSNCN